MSSTVMGPNRLRPRQGLGITGRALLAVLSAIWDRNGASWLAVAGVGVAVAGAPVALVRRITTFRSGSQAVAEIDRSDALGLHRIAASPQPVAS